MINVRCKLCGVELVSHPVKTKCCGCSNMTAVKGDTITANDLSKVVMISSNKTDRQQNILSPQDLEYQESRRNRKISKLNFEIR
jgi:hypothetical protein